MSETRRRARPQIPDNEHNVNEERAEEYVELRKTSNHDKSAYMQPDDDVSPTRIGLWILFACMSVLSICLCIASKYGKFSDFRQFGVANNILGYEKFLRYWRLLGGTCMEITCVFTSTLAVILYRQKMKKAGICFAALSELFCILNILILLPSEMTRGWYTGRIPTLVFMSYMLYRLIFYPFSQNSSQVIKHGVVFGFSYLLYTIVHVAYYNILSRRGTLEVFSFADFGFIKIWMLTVGFQLLAYGESDSKERGNRVDYLEEYKRLVTLRDKNGERHVYENIGLKFKKIAKATYLIGSTLSITLGLIMRTVVDRNNFVGCSGGLFAVIKNIVILAVAILVSLLGCALSWFGSSFLYGRGELIEDTHILALIAAKRELERRK